MSKKIYFIIQFFSAVFIITLMSCEKDATNIKLPKANPKLVVGCFISPQDTLIQVTLSRSRPIFGNTNSGNTGDPVPDASVTISDGINSVAVPYSVVNYRYELEESLFPIVSGHIYYLTVSTPQGESVSASCTVPESNLTSLLIDFIDTPSANGRINIKWQDISNQTNYYRVFAQEVYMDFFDSTYKANDRYIDNSLQQDNGKDGKEMSCFVKIGSIYSKISYDIYVLNIDPNYYNYYHSYENYPGDDPFSEPAPLYTNIKGGLGVFGAYQKLYVRKP